ncbi:MAG: hypothetical protein E7408_04570, partial [Ruminococcaceae bacterium]|nr:hypothetical protein [Oscillospiraceae bacterium]
MEVNGTKAITEAFSGAPIPKGAADFRVAALKTDVTRRSMRIRLSLSRIPDYHAILELKKSLRDYYALHEITVEIGFLEETPMEAEALHAFTVGYISETLPVVEYVLKDSVWKETEESLEICLHHGGKELLQSVSAGQEIARVWKSFTGRQRKVSFTEELEEMEIAAKPLP